MKFSSKIQNKNEWIERQEQNVLLGKKQASEMLNNWIQFS